MTNASITLKGNVNLAKVKLLGKYSGGIAGDAENVSFTFGNSQFQYYSDETSQATIGGNEGGFLNSATKSAWTGGIFGRYTCSSNQSYTTYDGTGFSFPTTLALRAATEDVGYAGALFGQLVLNKVCFSVAPPSSETLPAIACEVTVAAGSVDVGGLVGQVTGTGKADTLKVSQATASITVLGSPQYYGGLAGRVAAASVRADGVTVNASSTAATASFGGLVGQLKEKCVLNTENTVTVSTTSKITIGGGLVGQASKASVVRLSGETDLSNAAYSAGTNVGQLVGYQDSALIFATGNGNEGSWKYHRSTKSKTARVDDIGNYGQVIRLGGKLSSDLICIDESNAVTFQEHGDYGTIRNADAFALHAITFTSGNAFGIYPDFDATSDIALTADIDLSGTGIQGLNRDDGTLIFSGQTNKDSGILFNGTGHALTNNTGEPYGLRDGTPVTASDTGAGQCYRHGYYGLLGKVNSASVKNLTIHTTMNFGADVSTYAGAAIAYVDGGNTEQGAVNTIADLTVADDSSISYSGSSASSVGGFIGAVGGEKTVVSVANSAMNAALSFTGDSKDAVLGGILGKDTYRTSINMTFVGVTVKGSITNKTTTNAHVGGLVGDISAYDSSARNSGTACVTLKNVTISNKITTSAKSDYSSGGFLGHYWDNVDVTFQGTSAGPYAVTVNGANLTTAGSAAGGLCYAATGQWNLQGYAVSMQNVTISNGTGDLGLLVCHGERQDGTPGKYTKENNAKALYLVMDTPWDIAYNIDNVSVIGSPSVFYEIVAYTAQSKDITLNDAGIISLHTSGDKVVMDSSGTRNTYENRVLKGVTNPYSRYYYNLDTLQTDDTNEVNSPAELVLWFVYKYCAENIRAYLPAQVTSNKITGTLDLDGYSYYPVTVVNTDVDITNSQRVCQQPRRLLLRQSLRGPRLAGLCRE